MNLLGQNCSATWRISIPCIDKQTPRNTRDTGWGRGFRCYYSDSCEQHSSSIHFWCTYYPGDSRFVPVIGNYCVTSPMTIVRRCYLNDPLLPWRIVRGIQSDKMASISLLFVQPSKIVIPSSFIIPPLTILQRKFNFDLRLDKSFFFFYTEENGKLLANFTSRLR